MVADALRALSTVARARAYPWYVFGAQAVLVYGIPRLTADVDVTIDVGSTANADLMTALADAQLVPRAAGFDALLSTSRLLPLVHTPSATPMDLVLAGSGIEQDFLARAVTVDLGGFSVPILCVEDLIVTKVIASRAKDREDVLGILETQGAAIDLTRLRLTLAQIDASLDEPRTKLAFEQIHREFLTRQAE